MLQSILSYGTIGLCLALSILTYKLIANEQKKEKINNKKLLLTCSFIIMTIVLSGISLLSEKSQLEKLKKENDIVNLQIVSLEESINKLKSTNEKFEKIIHTIDVLLEYKGNLLNKTETINIIKKDLISLQQIMKKELSAKD